MRIRRYITAAAAAIGLTIAATLAVSTPAQAGYGCSGSLLEAQPIKNNSGTKIGEIQLYWDSSRGQNCASTVHGGPTWGVNLFTIVEVFVCPTNRTSSCKQGHDIKIQYAGYVSYYIWELSGPSSGRCVWARGWIDTGPDVFVEATKPGHCA
jgi:hypothetical protein